MKLDTGKLNTKFQAAMLLVLLAAVTTTSAAENQKDPKAMEVLNRMGAYTASMDQFVIKGEVFADARLDAGLIVSNPSEIKIKIDRPGSLHIKSFDGVATREIYIHKEQLTFFNSERNLYAQAQVPATIQEAMQYAMEEFDLDLPLADLFFADSAISLMTERDSIIYLTDKSRIGGADCHHIVVRGAEIDLQLWVEEGDRPVPRKMTMTMKWEGGSPQNTAVMDWSSASGLAQSDFEFKPPEGSHEIRFVGSE